MVVVGDEGNESPAVTRQRGRGNETASEQFLSVTPAHEGRFSAMKSSSREHAPFTDAATLERDPIGTNTSHNT